MNMTNPGPPAKGFHLGDDGLGINGSYQETVGDQVRNRTSKIAIRTDQAPVFYAGTNHTTLVGVGEGFYLGGDGISIGDTFRVTASGSGEVLIGRVTGNKKWTISGDSSNSYMSYNSPNGFDCSNLNNASTYSIGGNNNSVYIGTNGIRLGQNFAVDDNGNLVAKHLIAKTGGNIGGWTIGTTTLKSENNKITIDSSGNGSITGPNFYLTGDTSTDRPLSHIGGWYINQENLCATSGNYRVTLGTQGNLFCSYSTDNFVHNETVWSINNQGNAFFANLSVPANKNMNVAGTLTVSGSATINGTLTAGGVTLNNSGITATAGTIGGFTISSSGIGSSTGGNAYMSSNNIGATNGWFSNLYVNNTKYTATTITAVTGIELYPDDTVKSVSTTSWQALVYTV